MICRKQRHIPISMLSLQFGVICSHYVTEETEREQCVMEVHLSQPAWATTTTQHALCLPIVLFLTVAISGKALCWPTFKKTIPLRTIAFLKSNHIGNPLLQMGLLLVSNSQPMFLHFVVVILFTAGTEIRPNHVIHMIHIRKPSGAQFCADDMKFIQEYKWGRKTHRKYNLHPTWVKISLAEYMKRLNVLYLKSARCIMCLTLKWCSGSPNPINLSEAVREKPIA